ncbi:uncharacterized protein LY89DRAFT_692266 [Mollisia scopiformis]|uniref:Uncharacterized protein n=1 Tax=Mollisia scopiformis TaxID=149040 RepID=A0A132B2L1_MOLSC|nr:uncharacterized protein LY89DRAFT_692266 [Mollisia scopiformis]KUJ06635.1 hypothetical protein LY89DRAFT_692266 [Mollisia scopiformis]
MGVEHSKHENSTRPPPYTTTSRSTLPAAKLRQYPEIRATDVPDWKWNNTQCQEWLTIAIMEFCGRNEQVAQRKAREFLRGGFAPMLYAASYRVWQSYLGRQDAPAIYSYLMAHKSAAVPSGTYLTTYAIPTKDGYYS